mmetsp:Transcript_32784/g.83203  ORF Transcript_32784/g.83203 Transcript_32784/m.83203 type:complete len:350 (-) Transcript_32784:168-1217(-)
MSIMIAMCLQPICPHFLHCTAQCAHFLIPSHEVSFAVHQPAAGCPVAVDALAVLHGVRLRAWLARLARSPARARLVSPASHHVARVLLTLALLGPLLAHVVRVLAIPWLHCRLVSSRRLVGFGAERAAVHPHGGRPLVALNHGAARVQRRGLVRAVLLDREEQQRVTQLWLERHAAVRALAECARARLRRAGGADPLGAVGERGLAALLGVGQVDEHGGHARALVDERVHVRAVLLAHAVPQHLHVLRVDGRQVHPLRHALHHARDGGVVQAADEGAVRGADGVQHAAAVLTHDARPLHRGRSCLAYVQRLVRRDEIVIHPNARLPRNVLHPSFAQRPSIWDDFSLPAY